MSKPGLTLVHVSAGSKCCCNIALLFAFLPFMRMDWANLADPE